MAFFDEDISTTVRRKMVKNLCVNEYDSVSKPVERDTETSTDESKVEHDYEEYPVAEKEDEFNYELDEDEEDDLDDSNVSSRNGDEFEDCPKKLVADPEVLIKTFGNKDISHFVTRITLQFFRRFQIPIDFLSRDPSIWKSEKSYLEGLEILWKLKVVNDIAECGIQLMSTYNQMLTKD